MTKAERRQLERFAASGPACAVNLAAYLKAKAPRRKPSLRKAEKREKRLSKKGRWAEVKAAVFARAAGVCESCGNPQTTASLDPDHFYGKRFETVETVWGICRPCHRAKGENDPTRAYWDERFLIHCVKYGYGFMRRFTKELARPSVEGLETPLGTSTEEPVR